MAATRIIIASGDPVASAALAEQVKLAGFDCIAVSSASECGEPGGDDAQVVVWDADSLNDEPPLGALILYRESPPLRQPALEKPFRYRDLLNRIAILAELAAQPLDALPLNEEWALSMSERVLKSDS